MDVNIFPLSIVLSGKLGTLALGRWSVGALGQNKQLTIQTKSNRAVSGSSVHKHIDEDCFPLPFCSPRTDTRFKNSFYLQVRLPDSLL